MDKDSASAVRASGPANGLTDRELDLLRHYTDPESPGYRNATRSAELAGYRGVPGGNQLAVQGSRTLKRARELSELRAILDEKGCTFERAAERLSACLDAKRTRVFLTKSGTLIKSDAEDDFHQQRLAAKLVLQLHGAFLSASSQEAPTAVCHEPEGAGDHERASPEYRSAVISLQKSDAVDRDALRDVLACDAKSAEFEAHEQQSGTTEQSGQRVQEDDSTKA